MKSNGRARQRFKDEKYAHEYAADVDISILEYDTKCIERRNPEDRYDSKSYRHSKLYNLPWKYATTRRNEMKTRIKISRVGGNKMAARLDIHHGMARPFMLLCKRMRLGPPKRL